MVEAGRLLRVGEKSRLPKDGFGRGIQKSEVRKEVVRIFWIRDSGFKSQVLDFVFEIHEVWVSIRSDRMILFCRLLPVVLLLGWIPSLRAATNYVSLAGGHNPPFSSWADAATNIQAAIDLTVDGDVVLVSNGVYSAGSVILDSNMACRVTITNAVTVQSVNGPDYTVIEGKGPIGNSAVRCAYVGSNAQLVGFTLTNGFTRFSGTEQQVSGGGVMCDGGGLVVNCRIRNNAGMKGGGAFLNYGGTLRNCLIVLNEGGTLAGGVLLYNGGLLENCTVSTNYSNSDGGGIYCIDGGTIRNSIIYYNGAFEASGKNYLNSGSNMVYEYTCTAPLVGGTNNIASDPVFTNMAAVDYRLSLGSPCIDSGTNELWMSGEKDVDGNNRIMNGTVDFGCSEYVYYTVTASAGANGLIVPVGPRYVAYGAGTNFTMYPDLHYHVLDVQVDGSSVGASNSYAFVNVTSNHTINVAFTIDRFDLVVTNEHGAAVPAGTNTYDYGTALDCSITNSPFIDGTTQYVCLGWTGSGSVPSGGTQTNTSITITNASSITWQWQTNYWLDIASGADGYVVQTSAWYNAGSNEMITAVPSNGYHFTGWTGDISSTNNPLAVTMTESYSVTANFAINMYDITASAGANGSIAPTGIVQVAYGSDTNFIITPDPNYHVFDVMVDSVSVGPSNSYAFTGVTSNHSISALFAIDTYTLTVSTPYGTPSPAGITTNDYGTNISCTANSPVVDGTTQYVCVGWIGTGSVPDTGITDNVSFTITNASTITWLWTTNYWLHSVAGPDGSVDVGDGWYALGTNVTINATPALSADFDKWTGDVIPAESTNNPITILMDSPHSVTGNFVIITHYVSPAGSNISPYTTWENAATNIQDAIDVCENGARVLVTDGVYRLTAQLWVTNGIRIDSVNGPEFTVLDGNNSVGCYYSGHASNIVDGFTITGGLNDYGGGAEMNGGTIRNCIIRDNTAADGGGAYLSSGAVLRSCRIFGNYAGQGGGVSVGDTGLVQNCTIVDNAATNSGGGLCSTSDVTIINSIIYSNSAPDGTNYFISGGLSASYNCSIPLLAGAGNLAVDPRLNPSLLLQSASPCIDSGSSTNAPLTDLMGRSRWDHPGHANVVSIYDMGADEFIDADVDNMADYWEVQQFGAMTNSNGTADSDSDGLVDFQEYNNSLCPTNATTYYDSLNDNWKAIYGFTGAHSSNGLRGVEFSLLGGYDSVGFAYDLQVSNNYVYLADGDNGFEIVDVSTPSLCVRIGFYDTAGTAYGVFVTNNLAYVADGTNGLQIIDISVPASCTLTGGYVMAGTAYDVFISNSLAFVAAGTNGLQIVDVTTPGSCSLVGGYVTSGTVYGVTVSGSYAYLADSTGGLQVIDVSVPASCSNVGAFVTGGDVKDVAAAGSTVYLADAVRGLVVVDASDPTNCISTGGSYVFGASGVSLADTNVYMAGGWGLEVIDTNDSSRCVNIGRIAVGEPALKVGIVGNFAYVADGSNGVQIVFMRKNDFDQDGLLDSWEMDTWGDLLQGPGEDSDTDVISNWGEYLIGSSAAMLDTDGDNLDDGIEINTYLTDPRRNDTDGDGWQDGMEVIIGTDPRNVLSFPATIAGTIDYSGIQTGLVWIVVTNSAISTNVQIAVPGVYSVTNRHTITNHWISAFRDMNGNGQYDAWEAFGSYSNNPVYLTNNVTGIDITMVDPQYNFVVAGNPSMEGAPLPFGYGTNLVTSSTVLTNEVAQRVVNGATQYICTGWTGTGSVPPAGATTSVVVTITNASTLTWNWSPEYYQIIVTVGPNGGVSGTSGWYSAGSLMTNTVTPSNGYHFAGWTGDVPPANTNDTTLVLAVDQARSITANFAINMYTITPSVVSNGFISPSSPVSVSHGGTTNFTITPDLNHHIADVQVDGVPVGVTNGWTFSNVTTTHTINASFAIDMYSITASAGSNGTISPLGVVSLPYGGGTNFVITPDLNYYVTDVLVDLVSVGPVTNYIFSAISSNHTIDAAFDDRYSLTVSSLHGTAVPTGFGMYKYGTNISCSLINSPFVDGNTQYVCLGWVGTGSVPATGAGTNVVVTVTNTSTLMWTWTTNYWLNAVAGPDGAIDVSDQWVVRGSNVTINATASNHYHFVNWTGTITSTNNPLVLSMGQAHSVTANFAIDTYGITATAGPNGSLTPSGTVQVPYDSMTNFAINPNPNYHVTNVVVDGSSIGVTNDYSFLNVTNAHTIEAWFGVDMYELSVNSSLGTPSPAGISSYGWGTLLNCSVAGSPMTVGMTQYVCSGWTGTGSAPASGAGTNASFSITNNSTLTWTWQTMYQLNVVAGTNGSVIATNGWHASGAITLITAIPVANYHFTGWTGDIISTNNPQAVLMNRGYAATANFALNTYNITATAGPNGTITPSGVIAVSHGDSNVFTITPNNYCYISNVVVDGVPLGGTNLYVFTNVTAAHTIDATFAFSNNTLAVTSAYGTPSPARGTNVMSWGDVVNCVMGDSPVNLGLTQYVCVGWTGTGSVPSSGSGTNLIFTLTNNSTIVWQWRTNYWLDTASETNGSVDVVDGWYRAGTNVTITATALPGYWFDSWAGDVPPADVTKNPLTLTMSMPRSITATFDLSPYYVSTKGMHIWPFTSWQNAATNIQAAVNVAGNGRLVLVSNGTYVVSTPVQINNGIYIRSVNGSGTTIIDGGNSVRCMYVSHSNAIVEGFTFTHGRRAGDGNGGGMMIENGGLVRNCIFNNNTATNYGGGAYMYRGGILSNCTFSGNSANYGGAIDCSISGQVLNCTISGNSAYYGGGVRFRNGGIATNCTIKNNIAYLGGGGVQIAWTGVVDGCTLLNNTSSNYGGGAYCFQGGTITNSTISNNRSVYGGGVQIDDSGLVTRTIFNGNTATYGGGLRLKNGGIGWSCVINNNTAYSGGGVQHVNSGGILRNCSMSGNIATNSGGGVYCYLGGTIENCVISGNNGGSAGGLRAESGGAIYNTIIQFNGAGSGTNYLNSGAGVTYSHCCTIPLVAGDANITGDPRFLDAGSADFHLTSGSPCVDAGVGRSWITNAVDMDGNPRLAGFAVDMGVYEAVDSDGDGIPDTDETGIYGTDPNNADTDGDNMLDGIEVIAGTSPVVNSDVFKVAEAVMPADHTLVITWQSYTGRLYSVLGTRNLVTLPWTNISGYVDVPGNGGFMSWTNSVLLNSQDFYRIGVRLAP